MDMESFLELAKAYNNLGWAVQDQLVELDQGVPVEQMNPNALKMITAFLNDAALKGVEGTDIILDAIQEAEFDGTE